MARESYTNLGKEYLFYGWEDLRFPASTLGLPASNAPTFDDDYIGWSFANGSDARHIQCVVQIPHSWKRGTPIRPHVHFTVPSTNTGTVIFKFDYVIANINGTYNFASWSTLGNATYTLAASGQYKHLILSLGEIAMTGYRESCVLLTRLYAMRSTDTYADAVILNEFDIHYLIGKPGSYKEIPELP